jgi:hypothetical protein
MPYYIQVEDAARTLGTPTEELRQFEQLGWITTVEKDGVSYLRGHQEYRARFILDLRRRRRLRAEQIDKVLAAQKPPFNMTDVDRTLKED